MSVVIIGGNECMIRRYLELCREYDCKAKVYPKMSAGMKDLGNPDLLVLFTSTMSHKMLRSVLSSTKGQAMRVARSHSSSSSALRSILDEHTGRAHM